MDNNNINLEQTIDGAAESQVVNSENIEVVPSGPSYQLPDWLSAKTGPGSISDYLEHPLNFNKSAGLGRVIRGLTGIVGALDLAVIDIVMGILEVVKDKKGVAKVAAQ